MSNVPMLDAVSGQPASRLRFRGWMGFAVHAAACVALLFAGPLPSAQAQTRKTWNTTTGNWSTAGSWLPSGAPTGGTDTAVFEGTALTLLATGTAQPTIGQLVFNNTGTTTLSINRMTLTGSGATNSGTGILLGNSSGNVFISNTNPGASRSQAVNLTTDQSWINNSTSGTLSVQANGGAIDVADNRTLTLGGSGAFRLGTFQYGSLIYQGTGLLTLTSTSANASSFFLNSGTVRNETTGHSRPFGTARMTINGGAISQLGTGTSVAPLALNGSFSLVSGTLVLQPGNVPDNSGQVNMDTAATLTVAQNAEFEIRSGNVRQFYGNQQVTKAGLGALVLTRGNNSSFSGGFRLEEGLLVVQNDGGNAGSVQLGTGTFTIVGGTISSGVGVATLSMPSRFDGSFSVAGFRTGTTGFNLGSGTVTLGIDNPTVNVVDPAITFTVGGPIVGGANGLTKSGPGRMTLTGSSTYTGLTTVSSGTLQIGNGSTTGSVDGDIANNAMLVFNRSNAQTYGGVISGSGNLTKLQNTTLTLNGVNTFSGTTTVAGVISLGNALALQNSGIDTTNGNIRFTSAQTAVTFGGLIGSRALATVMDTNFTSGTSVTLNPQAGRSFSYSGVIANRGSNLALTKTGAGEQILSGLNTYTGLTTVSAGRLTIASGSINTSSGVTVNGAGAEFRYNSATAFNKTLTLTQGILSGTGTIQTAVVVGNNAIISPGNSPGSQTYLSSQWLENGTYQWELNALSGAAGTNWDKAVVTGLLDLTGLSASSKFLIDLTTLTGSNTLGPLDSAYVSGPTYIFPFVDFGSLTVGGTFSNAANSDLTALFSFNLANWLGTPKPSSSDISVKVNSAGTGLNLVIVPEPATIALAGIGIGTAVWFFRRRRTA